MAAHCAPPKPKIKAFKYGTYYKTIVPETAKKLQGILFVRQKFVFLRRSMVPPLKALILSCFDLDSTLTR